MGEHLKQVRKIATLGLIITILLIIIFGDNFETSSYTPPPKPTHSEIDACVMSQIFVKDSLKAPSTADFPACSRTSIIHHGAGKYTIVGYVDAQNSFGAMIRNNYIAELQYISGDKWRLLDLQFE